METLRADVALLERMGVVDYSLLLGLYEATASCVHPAAVLHRKPRAVWLGAAASAGVSRRSAPMTARY
eukprot:SAG25_NODE_2278_length_1759_cov_1.875301_1_plen_68_part_00